MEKEQILEATKDYVKKELENDYSGHDWWHIYRVTKIAKQLAKQENADIFICELAALLHDIADEKFNESEEAGLKKVENWLTRLELANPVINQVLEIISTMSFKGGHGSEMKTIEGKIVQDADRLDAIGAIGIARTFSFAGAFSEQMYDPDIPPRLHMTKEQYRKEKSTAINHFYEKLLKLKNKMNTKSAIEMAEERHVVMEQFLSQFLKEWHAEFEEKKGE